MRAQNSPSHAGGPPAPIRRPSLQVEPAPPPKPLTSGWAAILKGKAEEKAAEEKAAAEGKAAKEADGGDGAKPAAAKPADEKQAKAPAAAKEGKEAPQEAAPAAEAKEGAPAAEPKATGEGGEATVAEKKPAAPAKPAWKVVSPGWQPGARSCRAAVWTPLS